MSDVKDFELRKVFEMDALDYNFWLETDNQLMIVNLSYNMTNTLVEIFGIYKSEIFVGICLIPALFVKSNKKFDKHIKIIFKNSSGQSCLLCLAKSSSDKNVRHIEIGLIRRELRKKLNIETRRDCFTLSYSPCLS